MNKFNNLSSEMIIRTHISGIVIMFILIFCFIGNLELALTEGAMALDYYDSGSCGDDVNWRYYSNGTLEIFGNGNMKDYEYSMWTPWNEYRNDIETIVVQKGVTSIGDNAFDGCSKMNNVTLPEGLIKIGDSAFSYCCLKQIEIPDSVESIGSWAFESNKEFTDVVLPDGLTYLGSYAFSGCSELTHINIPASINVFESNLFADCKNITSICIPSNIHTIGYDCFANCTSLSDVTFSPGLKIIQSGAFGGCDGLTSISFPDGLQEIGAVAFCGCGHLNSISIPSSVVRIGTRAFFLCPELSSVTIPCSDTIIDSEAFGVGVRNFTISGVADSEAYKYAIDNGYNFEALQTDDIVPESSQPEDNNYGTHSNKWSLLKKIVIIVVVIIALLIVMSAF